MEQVMIHWAKLQAMQYQLKDTAGIVFTQNACKRLYQSNWRRWSKQRSGHEWSACVTPKYSSMKSCTKLTTVLRQDSKVWLSIFDNPAIALLRARYWIWTQVCDNNLGLCCRINGLLVVDVEQEQVHYYATELITTPHLWYMIGALTIFQALSLSLKKTSWSTL